MTTPFSLFPKLEPSDASPNQPAQVVRAFDEAAIDKFATLFSPATPRASPVLGPIMTPTMVYAKPRPRSYHQEASGSDSDFGSFVSVPAMEDPLAASDLELPPPIQGGSWTGESSKESTIQNPSLSFFDRFAQDAKASVERKKRGVLEELLIHEDDPLYWLTDQDQTGDAAGSNTTIWPEPEPEPALLADDSSTVASEAPSDVSSPLNDLDHEFFTTKPAASTLNQPRPHIAINPRHFPVHSSTLPLPPLPPTLAPPVADTASAPPSVSPPDEISDPLSTATGPERGRSMPDRRSPSYSTLTNLPSRFMSSLLPSSSKSNPTVQAASPSLESLFAFDVANPPSRTRAQSIDRQSHTGLYRTYSQPNQDVQISHGTPFARSLKSSSSPFASHIYIPPTGAPGYGGERYDWDKGFSAELERELSTPDEPKDKELVGIDAMGGGHTKGKGKAKMKDVVGELMEKKSGSVELLGRKASTVPLLGVKLADMIRTHLPALARLPRKWTLLYSLDQHGISLKTLYARCEAPMQPRPGVSLPAGALVVVKDAGDTLFGVWTGKEGVHPSRGKGYYGGGDSFLWKYVGGKLHVFKWTGKNNYVALCEPEYISFGGGDGNYGLYLDDTLFEGSSAPCPTFANEPLCSPGPKAAGVVSFECVGLEVWAVGP
ncbi:Oxidation resistance protein 1 [Hypsizygus marmoreus]|uniref:Oxidation resistance protein 1 n=1 Tax=Hypsizygus marmoreus TaxID=39966 RepID=A0A369J8A6_HYPMA|nr:Oxidation resistance protein 1 [Hypsizygus marmoreus]